ncbi:MerR family transcriptional regulator [Corynebacterium sp. S7]
MKISELSQASGTPMPTIKYYIREGLLGGGERVNETRTEYSDAHVHRLRLIRALVDVGKLPISSVQAVLGALDDPALPLGETFDIAQHVLVSPGIAEGQEPSLASLGRVEAVAVRMGWSNADTNVGRIIVARTLDTFERLGFFVDDEYLDAYARAANEEAAADLGALASIEDRTARTELMVTGTVLGDTLAAGLRRIAQAHVTAEKGLFR